MKKLLLILLIIPVFTFAQNDEKKSNFQFGGGFSIGGFYPSDVNDIVDDYFSNMTIESGFTDIVMNIGGRLFVGYTTPSNFGVEAFIEGAFAPKLITTDGDDISYSLNRFSPGAKLTYRIKLGRLHNIVLGAGPMYNNIKFRFDGEEILKGSSLGGKFEVAYQLNFRHIAPRAFIDVDLAKAKDHGVELNYSGVQFGLAFAGLW